MDKKRVSLLLFVMLMVNSFIPLVYAPAPTETVYVTTGFYIASGNRDAIYRGSGAYYETRQSEYVKSTSVDIYYGMIFNVSGVPTNATLINATISLNMSLALEQDFSATIYSSDVVGVTDWNQDNVTSIDYTDFANIDFNGIDTHERVVSEDIVDVAERIRYLGSFANLNGIYPFVMLSASGSGLGKAYMYESGVLNSPYLSITYSYQKPLSYTEGVFVEEIGGYYIYNVTSSVSNGTAFKWYDSTDFSMRMTTAVNGSYKTVNVNPTGNNTNAFEYDTIATVGSDIYTIVAHPTAHNRSLYKTVDRGDNWTKVVDVATGTATTKQYYAVVYDGVDVLHMAYQTGFDTYYRNYTISTNVTSTSTMIYDGGSNAGSVRAWYDRDQDTLWVTRFGGSPSNSMRQSCVLRKEDGSSWEYYVNVDDLVTGTRENDIAWANNRMYWIVKDYEATPSSYRLFAYELSNYSDITSWVPIGNQSFPRYVGDPALGQAAHTLNFDVGLTDTGYLIVAVERQYTGDEYVFNYRWNTGSKTWTEYMYNLTGFSPASQPEFHNPKMYYNAIDELRMAIVVEQDSGYSLIDKDWSGYNSWEGVPPTTVLKSTGHTMYSMGGDMYPYSVYSAGGYWVYDPDCPSCPPEKFDNIDDARDYATGETLEDNIDTFFDSNFDVIMALIGIFIIIFGCGTGLSMGILGEGFMTFMVSLMLGCGLLITYLSGGF